MEAFKMANENGLTIVEQANDGFRMSVLRDSKQQFKGDAPILQATLYKEDGVFVKDGSFLFVALDSNNEVASKAVDLEVFHASIDFFFASILNTDLYVKSIPKTSCFCSREMKQFKYD